MVISRSLENHHKSYPITQKKEHLVAEKWQISVLELGKIHVEPSDDSDGALETWHSSSSSADGGCYAVMETSSHLNGAGVGLFVDGNSELDDNAIYNA